MVKTRILIVTGSSGGHIFPALSLINSLNDKSISIDTLLVLPRKRSGKDIVLCGSRIEYLSASSIKIKLNFKNLCAVFNFLKSIFESLFILAEFKPQVVVGFGSLTSVPVVFLAWLFRIKTMLHEQNVLPGRANKFLAPFADRIAVSFFKTKDYLKPYQEKIVLTGNPLRQELKLCSKIDSLRFFGMDKNKLTILVMGGSQCSSSVNRAFLTCISKLKSRERLQVVHLTGELDYSMLKDEYERLGIEVRIFSFLKEMEFAYSASDIVISRAGATTIAELIYFSLPAILIPYPFAYRHQSFNAWFLESYGAAVMIGEGQLPGGRLGEALADLLNTPAKIESMRSAYGNIPRTQADNLLREATISLA